MFSTNRQSIFIEKVFKSFSYKKKIIDCQTSLDRYNFYDT